MSLKNIDIAKIRLANQQISEHKFKSVKELVAWMGAMQAQDYKMARWAIGVRLPQLTDCDVELALDKAQVIRTHILRPTWHLVSADDIYWMLELSAPRVKSLMNSTNKKLELTEAVFKKSNSVIEKALLGNIHLTREELMQRLEKANIKTDGIRSIHLMLRAELDGLVCNGVSKGPKQTYALLHERVRYKKSITKEEALYKLALTYYTSHAPATLADFVWWSGLSVADAKLALELIRSKFIFEKVNDQMYLIPNDFSQTNTGKNTIHLLPAYDEFVISYKDRSAALPHVHFGKAISTNGLFKPIVVLNGQVIGVWKRSFEKEKIILETNFFEKSERINLSELKKVSKRIHNFYNKQVEIV